MDRQNGYKAHGAQSVAYQGGVSLLEVLITTLVLGIGLLGVASLELNSISGNQEAFFSSQASTIAKEYASRIRSSRASNMLVDGNSQYDAYVSAFHNDNKDAFVCGSEPSDFCRSKSGVSVSCGLAELSLFAKWEACSVAEATLPAGEVRVDHDGNHLTIVVDWDSSRVGVDSGLKPLVNSECKAITGSNTRNCVILEMIP